ncbi:hypothetical protein [Rhodococcus qingshengii]|uniref:hypothetical protein n=1 Tax=Rhodococcus qingshengii TaxID=334542 RepID=UPI0035DAC655
MGQKIDEYADKIISYGDPERIKKIINPNHHVVTRDIAGNLNHLLTASRVDYNDKTPLFQWGGVRLENLMLRLNTAAQSGNPDLLFAARINGQCEIHCWVDGPDRSWFADLISSSRGRGFLRPEMGWETLVEMLHEDDRGPVVLGYSANGGFPDTEACGWWDGVDSDDVEAMREREATWEAMDDYDRWHVCMEVLRKEPSLQIRPETWDSAYFGMGLSFQDIFADDYEKRLSNVLRNYEGWTGNHV